MESDCFPLQEAENIVTKIKQQQYQELLNKDQLNMERNDGKVFLHFGELWKTQINTDISHEFAVIIKKKCSFLFFM